MAFALLAAGNEHNVAASKYTILSTAKQHTLRTGHSVSARGQ